MAPVRRCHICGETLGTKGSCWNCRKEWAAAVVTRFPTQILVVDDERNPVTINQLDSGDLDCTLCSTTWCQHIQFAIERDLDAEPLWRDLNGGQIELKVPCVPSAGIYGTVLVGDYMPALPCYKVSTLDFPTMFGSATREVFIGLLNPGECRRVLRMMLLEYFRGNHDPKYECLSTSHSVRAQYQWEKAIRTGGQAETVQRWSVLLTGQCLYCNETDNVDWDDLVPDAGKPPRRF